MFFSGGSRWCGRTGLQQSLTNTVTPLGPWCDCRKPWKPAFLRVWCCDVCCIEIAVYKHVVNSIITLWKFIHKHVISLHRTTENKNLFSQTLTVLLNHTHSKLLSRASELPRNDLCSSSVHNTTSTSNSTDFRIIAAGLSDITVHWQAIHTAALGVRVCHPGGERLRAAHTIGFGEENGAGQIAEKSAHVRVGLKHCVLGAGESFV